MATFDVNLTGVASAAELISHTGNTSNPHGVTKSQVGLGNVPNTDTTDPANITQDSTHRFVSDAQLTVIGNTSGTNTGDETAQRIGDLINGATDKATPVDADLIPLADSTASWITRKLSWANIKATLKTYFDTLYQSASDELMVRLASQQTTTSTTLVDCTGLSVSVEANTTYQIEGFIGFQSALATCGIFLSLNGPSSPTEIAYNINIPTASNAIGNRVMAAYDAGSAVADVPTINTTYFALLNGLLVNGPNAGTLIVRFASETGSTVRIQAGSSLRLRKVS